MNSIEAEPSTLRSLPFRDRREAWRSIGLGLLAAMFAITAFVGLFLIFRAEPARLEVIQWPVIPSVLARAPEPMAQPLPAPEPSHIAERKAEAAPTRRAAREKWSFCDVVHCAPRGQVPDE